MTRFQTPAPDKVRAFLDDLAALTARHGLALVGVGESDGDVRLVSCPRWMGGYEASPAALASPRLLATPGFEPSGYMLDVYMDGVDPDRNDAHTVVGCPLSSLSSS